MSQESQSGPTSMTQASTIGEDSSLIVTSGSSSPLRRAFSRKKSQQLLPSEQCAHPLCYLWCTHRGRQPHVFVGCRSVS